MQLGLSGSSRVSLKGTRDGLLITLGEGEWDLVLADLERQLARPGAARFFRGAKVSVDLGARELSEHQRRQMDELLAMYDIELEATLQAPTSSPRAVTPWYDETTIYTRRAGTLEALMIRRTLRSGQIVQHPGPIVIFGDVNDGAEIIAAGDVLVFGRLRGLVHAGAGGDDHATIGALMLNPPQLRIGNYIARAPEDPKPKHRGPEMACVREGRIIVEPWTV